MDLEYFSKNIIVREDYEEFLTDHNRSAASKLQLPVPYMLLYTTFKRICEEQHSILDKAEDTFYLSAAFTRLPNLTELCLNFCQSPPNEQWLGAYMDRTMKEQTFTHHLQVVTNALKAGRQCGICISTIHLSGLDLPYYCSVQTPKSPMLTTYLSDLFDDAQKLRLSGPGSPFDSLSCFTLDLQQLDICHVTISRSSMCNFLKYNARTIKSIGVHDVELVGLNRVEARPSEVLPILWLHTPKAPWSCSSADFTCFVCGEGGWRLLRASNDKN